jgi:hypothetical protein
VTCERSRLQLRTLLPLAVAMVSGCCLLRPTVEVSVQNSTGLLMRDVRVSITGQAPVLGNIQPGGRYTVSLRPSGSTELEVAFLDSAGRHCRAKLDLYMTKGYCGRVNVTVRSCDKADFEDRMQIY